MSDDRAAGHAAPGSAPGDEARPGGWALLAGLLLAPGAWFVQTSLAQTIAARACFPHERPVARPALPWLAPGLAGLSVLMFLTGTAGMVIAWRNWQRTEPLARGEGQRRAPARQAARDCFLARVGTISRGVFMVGLVAADMALALVPPCGG